MATVTKTSPTFTQIEPPVVIASGSLGTLRTLDLRTSFGAWLYVRIGRRVSTALTRSAYVSIRRTDNDSLVLPIQSFDVISQTVAAVSTTTSGASNIGDGTLVVTSATGLVTGDTLCLHSDDTNANRVEFARIVGTSGTTLTLERPLRVAHNNLDRVTTLPDLSMVYLPGGDHYEIRCINNSGQSLLFAVDCVQEVSETIT